MSSEESVEDLNGKLENPVLVKNFRPNIVIKGCKAYEEVTCKISLGQGNIFTGVCSLGGLPERDPLDRDQSGQRPPVQRPPLMVKSGRNAFLFVNKGNINIPKIDPVKHILQIL